MISYSLNSFGENIQISNTFSSQIYRVNVMSDFKRNKTGERFQWEGKLEFLFTTFGYTVGLGNIWRYSYRCYTNGGGAFLVPYWITLLFCALPMLFLEMFLGQYFSTGPITVWSFSPLFKGLGWAMIFVTFVTNIYYIVLVAYVFYYMLVSFVNLGEDLPWQRCNIDTPEDRYICRTQPYPKFGNMTEKNRIQTLLGMMNKTCIETTQAQPNVSAIRDLSFKSIKAEFSHCEIKFITPEEQYWKGLLDTHESNDIENLGPVVGRNAILLFIVWVIVFLCSVRGIRCIAKWSYVTVTLPSALLVILLVRGLTLEGYDVGLHYYLTPDWSRLSDWSLWASAATQVMYSTGIGDGALICLASYNKFKHNILRDSILLGLVNAFTSMLGGLVVFCFLGHASVRLNKPLEDIFDKGPGLIFISYIQGLSQLPSSSMWSCLFFAMVFTLGLDSVFVMSWATYASIADVFPRILKRRKLIFGMICLISFLLGLPMVTRGGIHMVVLFDGYIADYAMTIFLLAETIAIVWFYGIDKFLSDVDSMLGNSGKALHLYLRAMFVVTVPVFCLLILCACIVGYTKTSYDGTEVSASGEAIGLVISCTPIVIFLSFMVYQIADGCKNRQHICETIRKLTQSLVKLNDQNNHSFNPYITPTSDFHNENTELSNMQDDNEIYITPCSSASYDVVRYNIPEEGEHFSTLKEHVTPEVDTSTDRSHATVEKSTVSPWDSNTDIHYQQYTV
ncbi:sodium-dependent proline transporter-like [Mercenaria mercenaria]|uniref:sodium-dependent proline transporter-like n=1 Tax=Mercenaria mercenaria TaxID=6596 RepID=UPI00234F9296|nr:sodium-dependent proline transporter-like [Mercenaria mercenaria]